MYSIYRLLHKFLPKLLLLVVLLTFGGCQILRYNFGVTLDGDLHDTTEDTEDKDTEDEGTQTETTFLDYFKDGNYYEDRDGVRYTYSIEGDISYLEGLSFDYYTVDGILMTGIFSEFDNVDGIGTVLTATVYTSSKSVVIKSKKFYKTFFEYFKNGVDYQDQYGKYYTYNSADKTLGDLSHNDDGIIGVVDTDGTVSITSTFGGFDEDDYGTFLTATVDISGESESITVSALTFDRPFLAYFTVGEWYGDNEKYIYTIDNDKSKLYGYEFNEDLSISPNGTMTGTFGAISDDGTTGYEFVATVSDKGILTVTVSKGYLEYFEDGKSYLADDNKYYTYDSNNQTLGGYKFNDFNINTMLGTFGAISDDGTTGYKFVTTVTDGEVSVTVTKGYLEYFEDGKSYLADDNKYYTYDSNNQTLGGYKFNGDLSINDMKGTFGAISDDGTTGYKFVATVSDTGVLTVTVTKGYFEYFEDKEYLADDGKYYTYDSNNQTLGGYEFNGDDYDYMDGTFGELDEDGYGTVLTATVNTSSGTITVTVYTKERPTDFSIKAAYYKSFGSTQLNFRNIDGFVSSSERTGYITVNSGHAFYYVVDTEYISTVMRVTTTDTGYDNNGWIYISGTSSDSTYSYVVLLKFQAKSLEEINSSTPMFFLAGFTSSYGNGYLPSYFGIERTGDFANGVTTSVVNTYTEDSNIWNLNTD